MENRPLLGSGQLDPNFGEQGIAGQTYAASDIASYPDGRFLVAGAAAYNASIVERFTADGRLDPTFGTLGTAKDSGGVAVNHGREHLALQTDGTPPPGGGTPSRPFRAVDWPLRLRLRCPGSRVSSAPGRA